jgi:hypothetical protein
MAKKNITESLPALQQILSSGQLEKSLRDIAGAEGNLSFSLSLNPASTSYSFSMSAGDGTSENYSKTVPYQGNSPE